MLITLAIQETEIRRIMVRSQPQASSSRDPIMKKLTTKKYWWSQGKGPEFKPVLQKKKKKKRKERNNG
jgi:hypothetical protein